MSTSGSTMHVGGSSPPPYGGESSKRKIAPELPVLHSRYVLSYTVNDMPDEIILVAPQTSDYDLLNEIDGSCCEDFGTWSDPHLVHTMILHCPLCDMDLSPIDNLTASYSTYNDDGNKYHVEQQCPSCPNSSQVRILRRGKKYILCNLNKNPVLDVEVVGQLVVQCHLNVPRYNFNLVCKDRDDMFHTTVRERLRNPDRSFNLQIEGYDEFRYNYKLRGFRGCWEEADWNDDFFDAFGLRVIDNHCATKNDWPPAEWKSDEDSQSDEDEHAYEVHDDDDGDDDLDDDDGGDGDNEGNGDNKNDKDDGKDDDKDDGDKNDDETSLETEDDEDEEEEDVGEDQGGEGESSKGGGSSNVTPNVYDGLVMVEREVYGYQGETSYEYRGHGYGEYGTFYREYQGYSEYEGQGGEYYHHYQQHDDDGEDDEDGEE